MFNISNFYKCEKKLTINDLNICEDKLGIKFPISLTELYLNCNGGCVYKGVYKRVNPPYRIEISNFIPIKYNKSFKNDPDFLLDGIALKYWNEKNYLSFFYHLPVITRMVLYVSILILVQYINI